ncbi:hypothetical protein KC721_03615, partial [Candidatus Woesebacteria bacterium]|nr:hypothetical protein [Candidatus Woesebacteria bacterium]
TTYFATKEPVVTVRISQEALDLTIVAAHPLPPFTKDIAAGRQAHLRGLGQYISLLEQPVLLLGDLNVTEFSPLFDDLVATAGLQSFRSNQGLFGTWPAQLPAPLRIGIDHVLYKGAMQPRVTIGEPNGSDHLPLILEI